jgi:hypothetical protein
VDFTVLSHTPHPYQLCYCSICRKTAGGGGYAINLMGQADTLTVRGREAVRIYHAEIAPDDGGKPEISPAERHFCSRCGSHLWLFDPCWPDLVHPLASAIDTPLPLPPVRTHLMLRYKASWVEPAIGPKDRCYDEYPEESIEEWHRRQGLWLD